MLVLINMATVEESVRKIVEPHTPAQEIVLRALMLMGSSGLPLKKAQVLELLGSDCTQGKINSFRTKLRTEAFHTCNVIKYSEAEAELSDLKVKLQKALYASRRGHNRTSQA
jgi:hypothetical protein